MKKDNISLGFTLLEVLLSLFIIAILVTILSVVFNTGLRSYRQGRDLLNITRSAQLALGQMTQDILGAMIGPNIIFKGETKAVFFMAPIAITDEKLDLCEVGYLYDAKDKELVRHYLTYWGRNGRNTNFKYPKDTPGFYGGGGSRTSLCNNVVIFNLRYWDSTGWKSSWSDDSKLPTMVEIQLAIQGDYPQNAPKQKKTFTTRVYIHCST